MAVIKITDIHVSNDIGQVLRGAGGSVDVDEPLTFFEPEAKNNKWSLKKPVPSDDLYYDYDETVTLDGNSSLSTELTFPWFVGKKKKEIKTFTMSSGESTFNVEIYYLFGLAIPVIDTTANVYGVKDLIDRLQELGWNWEYATLKGGTEEPYRIDDFRGYSTQVNLPFQYIASDATTNATSINISLFGNFSPPSNSDNDVTLRWIGKVFGDNWEVGVLIVNSSNKYVTSATGNQIGFAGTGCTLNDILPTTTVKLTSMLPAGSYKIYYVLRDKRNTARFIPLPHLGSDSYTNPQTITVSKYIAKESSFTTDIVSKSEYGWFRFNNSSSYPKGKPSLFISDNSAGLCSLTYYYMSFFFDATDTDENVANFVINAQNLKCSYSGASAPLPVNVYMYVDGVQTSSVTVKKGEYKRIELLFDRIFGNNASSTTVPNMPPMARYMTITFKVNGADKTYQCPICITQASAAKATSNTGKLLKNGTIYSTDVMS